MFKSKISPQNKGNPSSTMSAFPAKKARTGRPQRDRIIKTSYTSQPVPIPDTFLTPETHSGPAVTYSKIDFSKSIIPEYRDLYAVILDNVLTPQECNQLISLAEQSTGAGAGAGAGAGPGSKDGDDDTEEDENVPNDDWQPAMVNAGPHGEFLATDYRNSDRIIWDEKTIVARLWGRCLLAPGIQEDLGVLEGNAHILGQRAVGLGHRWMFSRLNERMRFLRYGPGQFFKGTSISHLNSFIQSSILNLIHFEWIPQICLLGNILSNIE
jgi:hypothetical protein